MPLAICHVPEGVEVDADRVVRAWSAHSGVEPTNMTVTVVRAAAQGGAPAPVLVTLALPSLWSAAEVDRLQLGLAAALAGVLARPPGDVTVVTSVVAPGHVVEDGTVQRW